MATLNPPFRAPDMESLFKKVQKGLYDKIPLTYSKDLAEVIGLMLKVEFFKINSR
jgi:NIMA (never in mitosis gene a)-related kinase